MQHVLVTGGLGFIGSYIVHALILKKHLHVTILDDLSFGKLERLPSSECKNWEFVKKNVNNYEEIAKLFRSRSFDYVYHFAAQVGVRQTFSNPLAVMDDLKGIENILKLANETGTKRIFFASSSEVYGNSIIFPQNESTTPLDARHPYATVKATGEMYHQVYQKTYGLNYTIFRLFNVYGPHQRPSFVISKFMYAAVNNEPITLYGKGKQTRTFCWIEDAVDTMVNSLELVETANEIVNIGSQEEINILQLAELILKVTHSSSEIICVNASHDQNRIRRRFPDIQKMLMILQRDPITLSEGLSKILSHLKHHIHAYRGSI